MNKSGKTIKAGSLYSIRYKLLIIYVLNVVDIVFTLFLIKTGYFIEANIIMRLIITAPLLAVIVKTTVPGILILFVWKRMASANSKQLAAVNYTVTTGILLYLLIVLSHILWLCWLLHQGLVKLCIIIG